MVSLLLDQIPATFTSKPKCYRGCSVDEKQKKVLSLPPRFAVYNRVDVQQCEAEIEKGLAKLRWTNGKQTEVHEGGEGREEDQVEEERSVVYDIGNETFDFRNMRASDVPFNKRVHLPKPLDEDESLAKKEERSALWKHCKEKHDSEMQKFEMNVTGSYSNDAMLRHISERVRIDQVPGGSLMNSENEWN